MKRLIALAALLFATPACAGKAPATVNGWYAGPQIGNTNYSPGIVLQPLPGGVLQFDIPGPSKGTQGQIDALVTPVSVLPSSVSVAYTLTAPVYYSGSNPTNAPTIVSVAFQRRGDNWSGSGVYQQYRWYSTTTAMLIPGTNIFSVDFTTLDWFDVYGQSASLHPAEFAAAKADPQAVMITFGCDPCGGRSHGVIGPSHFNLLGASFAP